MLHISPLDLWPVCYWLNGEMMKRKQKEKRLYLMSSEQTHYSVVQRSKISLSHTHTHHHSLPIMEAFFFVCVCVETIQQFQGDSRPYHYI